nr:HD domain-containing protein [uncultured Desulfobulbus sp.]
MDSPSPIPTLSECLSLMEQYAMLDNIRHHSLVVARLAAQIQEGLSSSPRATIPTDRQLVISGALLHDIAKTPCLNSTCDHAKEGGKICREHGYPEIAAIVEQHVLLWEFEPSRYAEGCFTEREIVYYADKRVRHHTVVGLDKRLEYILEHYGQENPVLHGLIRKNFKKCVTLEAYLFRFLPFAPNELGRY